MNECSIVWMNVHIVLMSFENFVVSKWPIFRCTNGDWWKVFLSIMNEKQCWNNNGAHCPHYTNRVLSRSNPFLIHLEVIQHLRFALLLVFVCICLCIRHAHPVLTCYWVNTKQFDQLKIPAQRFPNALFLPLNVRHFNIFRLSPLV